MLPKEIFSACMTLFIGSSE